MKRIVFFLFVIYPIFSFSQEIKLKYDNTPLNKVLVDFHDKYDLLISFDDRLLSTYSVTNNNTYSSPDVALTSLIGLYPLQIEKNGDVYIIYKPKKTGKPKNYAIAGQVIDARNGEPLPYSHVILNVYTTATDVKGSFSFISVADSVFNIKASHLGYYILDTILYSGTNYKLALKTSNIGLSEVVITDVQIEMSTQI